MFLVVFSSLLWADSWLTGQTLSGSEHHTLVHGWVAVCMDLNIYCRWGCLVSTLPVSTPYPCRCLAEGQIVVVICAKYGQQESSVWRMFGVVEVLSAVCT